MLPHAQGVGSVPRHDSSNVVAAEWLSRPKLNATASAHHDSRQLSHTLQQRPWGQLELEVVRYVGFAISEDSGEAQL